MDNPQHYQPLSHALHPPVAGSSQYSGFTNASAHKDRDEEEDDEEEEEEDEDEGIVEEQLGEHDAELHINHPPPDSIAGKHTGSANASGSHAESSNKTTTLQGDQVHQQKQGQHQNGDSSQQKRRPGRPRGSKNRKSRASGGEQPVTPTKAINTTQHPGFYQHPPIPGQPQHSDVNPHNHQYYEFQWRVLNLCAEFYGAAEELVKATPSLVVAQCYQMGSSVKVDPLTMLGDAKRICDSLLANPSRLTTNPPPPIYPVIPTFSVPVTMPPPSQPSVSASTNSNSKSTNSPASVITNPQSFVLSLAPQAPVPPTPHSMPHMQYPTMYGPSAAQYPTSPYYQFPGYTTPGFYPSTTQAQPQTSISVPPSTMITPSTSGAQGPHIVGSGGNQGAWSDEETERLKKLAEQSKSIGTSGDIEWDWVVHQWGNTRTRHQILIKATSLGLKESSSRGVKRRRDTDTVGPSGESPRPAPQAPSSGATSGPSNDVSAPSVSPPQTHAMSTPATSAHQSPAIHHARPPSTSQPAVPSVPSNVPASINTSTPRYPFPMPTVAATTPSPIITASQTPVDPQRTSSYYRPRPNQTAAASSTSASPKPPPSHVHPYMFTPNGSMNNSRLGKENGPM